MMSLQVVAQGTSTFGYSLSPTDGKYPVPVTQGDFVITMNTPVKAVYNGTISLNNYNGTEYVPANCGPVTKPQQARVSLWLLQAVNMPGG
jgi:hypothetical protein